MLLKAWKKSISFFFSTKNFFSKTITLYGKSLVNITKYFGWAVFLDLILFFIFKKSTFSPLLLKQPIPLSQTFLHLVITTLWFVISVSFILALRKKVELVSKAYFFIGFLHYISLSFFLSFILFIFLSIIISLKIVVFPEVPWYFHEIYKPFTLLVVFYWLDYKLNLPYMMIAQARAKLEPSYFKNLFYYFKDAFKSIERGLNIFIYNLPFFLIIIGLQFLCHLGIHMIFFTNLNSALLATKGLQPFYLTPDLLSALRYNASISIPLIKYCNLLISFLFISIMFLFYTKKKHITYSNYVFK